MKHNLLVLVLLGLLFSWVVPTMAAGSQVSVTANVLAEFITVRSNKSLQITNPIVGFKAGSVSSFQSLTTFTITEPGVYTFRLDIIGPDEKTRAFYTDQMESKVSNWTQQQLTHWPSVNFNVAGIYHFVVRVNNKQIAAFPISVTK